jgi:hypothetical protein
MNYKDHHIEVSARAAGDPDGWRPDILCHTVNTVKGVLNPFVWIRPLLPLTKRKKLGSNLRKNGSMTVNLTPKH